MSDLDIFADLDARKLVGRDGGTATLPTFVLGDTIRFELRTLKHNENGEAVEKNLSVRTLRASIGKVMTPPDSGIFTVKIEDPGAPGTFYTSEPIAFDATADTIKTTLDAMLATLTWSLSGQTKPAPGCWLFKISVGAPAVLLVDEALLSPESFVRIRSFQSGGDWWHELRLVQVPASWNVDGSERVLPAAPSVVEVYPGFPATESDPGQNELQDLTIPEKFRGTYFLRWNFRRSTPLGISDGPVEIQAALEAMFTTPDGRFNVTNPTAEHVFIEFTGDLKETPQNEITVDVQSFPPGVLTFTMPLTRPDLHALLRTATTVELPFEVELEIVNDGEDPENLLIAGRIVTLFQTTVIISREQIYPELATVDVRDWLRPPTPRSYVPFNPSQRVVGDHHFTAILGDGVLDEFDLPHNLASGWLRVTLINLLTGRQLPETEWEVVHSSVNDSTVYFTVAPALNSIGVIVSAAGPIDTFIAELLVEIEQVNGLQDELDAIRADILAIQVLLPTTPPLLPAAGPSGFTIDIPERMEIFPGRFGSKFDPAAAVVDINLLPRAPGLMPAIHDAAATANATGLLSDPADHEGEVFQNTGADPLELIGGMGHRSETVPVNGFYGSDGRRWYALTHATGTTSYYPTDAERELFMVPVSAAMLRAGMSMSLPTCQLQGIVLKATTRAQLVFVIEVGTSPKQTSPATTGDNLEDIVWNTATPLLSQRIILAEVPITHRFGFAITRDIAGAFTASTLKYGVWAGGAQAPEDPTFTVRGRLIEFDTENSVTGERGFVFYKFTADPVTAAAS